MYMCCTCTLYIMKCTCSLNSSNVLFSPLLGDDFLSELDLRTIYCYVGAQPTKVPIRPRFENMHNYN